MDERSLPDVDDTVKSRLALATSTLPATSKTREIKRRILKNLYVVSFGFLFTFTAFGSLEKLQSSLHSDERLGLTSLIVIYTAFIVSCMFIPSLLIDKLGPKHTLMLSMSGYVTFTLANFYPRYWTLLPTSAILGKMKDLRLSHELSKKTFCTSKHSSSYLHALFLLFCPSSLGHHRGHYFLDPGFTGGGP